MKLFGIILICALIILVIVWIKLQEEPAPVIITLTFTGALIALTVKFGLKAPLMIFGVLIGAFVVFLLLPAILSLIAPIGRMEFKSNLKRNPTIYQLYKAGIVRYESPTRFRVDKVRGDKEVSRHYDISSSNWTLEEVLEDSVLHFPYGRGKKLLDRLGYGITDVGIEWEEPVYDEYSGEHCNDIRHYEKRIVVSRKKDKEIPMVASHSFEV